MTPNVKLTRLQIIKGCSYNSSCQTEYKTDLNIWSSKHRNWLKFYIIAYQKSGEEGESIYLLKLTVQKDQSTEFVTLQCSHPQLIKIADSLRQAKAVVCKLAAWYLQICYSKLAYIYRGYILLMEYESKRKLL